MWERCIQLRVAMIIVNSLSSILYKILWESFQLVSRVSVDTCASETLSVNLRNARIDCTTRVIVMYRPPSSCFKTFLDDVSKVLLFAAASPTCCYEGQSLLCSYT